jgi:sugar diacid utilization regulator
MPDALVDALLDARQRIAIGIRERLQRELPDYANLPVEVLDVGIRAEVERVLCSARTGQEAAGETELAELAEVGELRARQGVPVETMLRAWRIGIQVVIAHSRELGERMGIGAGDLLEFIESLLAWSDVAMVTTAAAHRRAELEVARREQEHRTNLVRSVLLGTMGSSEIGVQAASYGVDLTREYVAVRARPAAQISHRNLERALGFHEAVQHRRGLSALLDGDLAGFLRERPAGEPPGVVGVGPPRPLDRLADSFRLATRALISADAFGLTGIHDITTLGLRCAVVADGDVGNALCRRYLDPLPAGSAAEIVDSLRAYFACGMRVEPAAAQLYVHPNTLRYRLARFEELTGTSLRDPGVGFEVWWALQRAAMRAGPPATAPEAESDDS